MSDPVCKCAPNVWAPGKPGPICARFRKAENESWSWCSFCFHDEACHAPCDGCEQLRAEAEKWRTAALEQSQYVQQNWLSPIEADGLRARVAELERDLRETLCAADVEAKEADKGRKRVAELEGALDRIEQRLSSPRFIKIVREERARLSGEPQPTSEPVCYCAQGDTSDGQRRAHVHGRERIFGVCTEPTPEPEEKK